MPPQAGETHSPEKKRLDLLRSSSTAHVQPTAHFHSPRNSPTTGPTTLSLVSGSQKQTTHEQSACRKTRTWHLRHAEPRQALSHETLPALPKQKSESEIVGEQVLHALQPTAFTNSLNLHLQSPMDEVGADRKAPWIREQVLSTFLPSLYAHGLEHRVEADLLAPPIRNVKEDPFDESAQSEKYRSWTECKSSRIVKTTRMKASCASSPNSPSQHILTVTNHAFLGGCDPSSGRAILRRGQEPLHVDSSASKCSTKTGKTGSNEATNVAVRTARTHPPTAFTHCDQTHSIAWTHSPNIDEEGALPQHPFTPTPRVLAASTNAALSELDTAAHVVPCAHRPVTPSNTGLSKPIDISIPQRCPSQSDSRSELQRRPPSLSLSPLHRPLQQSARPLDRRQLLELDSVLLNHPLQFPKVGDRGQAPRECLSSIIGEQGQDLASCIIEHSSVKLENYRITPHGAITTSDTQERRYRRRDQGEGEKTTIDTPYAEEETPSSGTESDGGGYDTPLTSPCSSEPKVRLGVSQVDGTHEGEDDGCVLLEVEDETARTRAERVLREALERSESDDFAIDEVKQEQSASRSQHEPIDLTLPAQKDEANHPPGPDVSDTTPLAPASPAKGATAFPFPNQSAPGALTTNLNHLRYPSALLRQCERNATPRQRRLMAGGIQSPDRFIRSRAATPTKEALLLPKPAELANNSSARDDPFGPTTRRSLRNAEQYATIRAPPPVIRGVGFLGSRVRDAQLPTQRAASAGGVWTVGGTVVTEGVASTTNGRGGRTTSGTSAPHYTADFLLKRKSPSEEEVRHRMRLAIAMGVDPVGGTIEQSSPSPCGKEKGRVWRDGAWVEEEVELSPTKVRAKKEKNMPVIPFRVLDAPALRDDYYCSILAYSHTVECLAVGLGPHVYLWSENRGKTNIPDSLTAPLGTAHVTSVSFSSREGGKAILAIGRADGRITLWSPMDQDPRFDSEQPAPVSCVQFRPNTVRRRSLRDPIASVQTEELLVGDEVGCVYYYSIDWPDQDQRDLFDWHGSMTLLARITCHSQQICGIAWTPDGEFFATGGNDNQLFLFESRKILQQPVYQRDMNANMAPAVHVRAGSTGSSNATVTGQGEVLSIMPGQEKHIFSLNAAVKAIAFAPWQHTLLAAGGGSNDRCIHFFHTLSAASLATIDCHAQVTSLVWSARRKEIAATFGFAQPEHAYRVAVFAWPSCTMMVGIPWLGEERALFAVPYPRGPSTGNPTRPRDRRATGARARGDTEGQPWYSKRTVEEGCLVVATSDASIKFHEVWAENKEIGKRQLSGASGVLGGSQILEGECSAEMERPGIIR